MKNISVIIPTYHFADAAKRVIQATLNQTLRPTELIIIDSSSDNSIEDLANSLESDIPIVYHRVDQAFPGEARNKGAAIASQDWLAFLDSKTVPVSDWLESNFEALDESKADIIFGTTKYLASSSFQKCLQACVYGLKTIETTPGTLIQKSNFDKIGGFREGVRTGDDMEWRETIKRSTLSYISPKRISLTYNELPEHLLPTLKRFFIYQLHTSRVDIQNTSKSIMFSFFLIFMTILVPKWNSIVGWEDSIFYFPNITKIYISSLAVFALLIIFLKRNWVSLYANSIVGFSIVVSTMITFFLIAVSWNEVIAGWVEDSVWYFPHITKIYVFLALFSSIAYRGIYFPLKNGFAISDLLPFWWLKVGLLGLMLDIVKAPGYILGALLNLLSK
jgi:glycosyltransferase involved in cell wall biosynthesis